jgi:hypothetical protein
MKEYNAKFPQRRTLCSKRSLACDGEINGGSRRLSGFARGCAAQRDESALVRLDPREEIAHHLPEPLRFFRMAHMRALVEID